MGYEAQCQVRVEGTVVQAKAVLEQQNLVVRGPLRLSIPLSSIKEATAVDGWLRVRFGRRLAEIELGPASRKWANRIMNPPSRLQKLGIKAGMRVLIAGRVQSAFVQELRAAGATILRGRPESEPSLADLVFYAVERRDGLEELEALASRIVPDGAIWTLRLKGQREVTEADTMAAGKRAGLVDVKVVSFSDTVTAEKFVIPVANRPKTDGARRRLRSGALAERTQNPAAVRPKAPPGGRSRQTTRTA